MVLLNQFADVLFLICASVAGWRLWLIGLGVPGQLSGISRPPAPLSRRQDRDQNQNSPAPFAAPVPRGSRSLDRTLAELEGMVGLASTIASGVEVHLPY